MPGEVHPLIPAGAVARVKTTGNVLEGRRSTRACTGEEYDRESRNVSRTSQKIWRRRCSDVEISSGGAKHKLKLADSMKNDIVCASILQSMSP